MTSDRVIGKDGKLPWNLPEDLKFFKKTTLGYPIVMGRKTFESIGRPLPKRTNIVITRDKNWSAKGVLTINSPEELVNLNLEADQAFIIGGAEIYKEFLEKMDSIIITHVKSHYKGDTHFPEFSKTHKNEKILQKEIDFYISIHKR